jgi:hypothetical protein
LIVIYLASNLDGASFFRIFQAADFSRVWFESGSKMYPCKWHHFH